MRYRDEPLTINTSDRVLTKLQQKDFALVYGGTSTGKTFIAIRTAALLDQRALLLIVAPKAKALDHSWFTSTDAYNQSKQTDLKVLQYTYGQLYRPKYQRALSDALKANDRPVIFILDEIHEIKKSTGKSAKAAIGIAKSNLVVKTIGLTATPWPNSYVDAASYLIMNGTYKNQTDFYNQQVLAYDQYHNPIVKRKGKLDRHCFADPDYLDAQINSFTVRVENKQAQAKLPPVKVVPAFFHLENSIRYVEPAFADFNDRTLRTRAGHYKAAIKYYQQGYYDNYMAIRKTLRMISAADPIRFTKVGQILRQIQHPIVIFYQFNDERDLILTYLADQFPNHEIRLISGAKKDMRPITQPATVYVIQYRAGGTGIELKETYATIFFMPTYSYKDIKQAVGRNVRIGMTHSVTQYQLVCKDAIDWAVWSTVSDKADFNKILTLKYLVTS